MKHLSVPGEFTPNIRAFWKKFRSGGWILILYKGATRVSGYQIGRGGLGEGALPDGVEAEVGLGRGKTGNRTSSQK